MIASIVSKDPPPNSNYLLKLKKNLAFKNASNIQNICPFFRHSSKLTPESVTTE
jgi:hypothetical protein